MMHCDPEMLWTLVEQHDEPGETARAIARHLESCESCRARLADFGGEAKWWDDARRLLSDVQGADSEQHALPTPPPDLSFLDEPVHPEMLGRIGRYDVEALIGRGGMGVVLRGFDRDLHRTVAIKVMAPEWAASTQARRRFAREAQAAASVAHENVVPIYNVEADAKQPFLVMQYVPGMTLQSWVKSSGPPKAATILRVAGQLAEGLSAAHRRGLVHRDVKPGNVLVGNNVDRVWITDFGLARAADSITLTRTGVIAGTPHYMSPEQARGEPIDHRSDLFSLGSVLYFLSTGRPPFDAENTLAVLHQLVSVRPARLTAHRDDLPPSLVSLVDQLLRPCPSKRPSDCDAVLARLADAQQELRSGKVARPPLSRRKKIALGTAASLAAILAWLPSMLRDPVQPTNLAVVDQPGPGVAKSSRMDDPFGPYIVRASRTIESATAVDDRRFQEKLAQISSQIQRLSQPDLQIGVPSVSADDSHWRQKVDALESLIYARHP